MVKRIRLIRTEGPVAVAAPPKLTAGMRGRACEYCEHVYIYPCDGKSDTCMNRKFRMERLAAEVQGSR